MPSPQETFDVIIIGGGIAGSALAAVLARTGRAVLVLERSTVYRDKVRGELFHAWGVAEAQRLGLYEGLIRSGGIHHTRFVPYDEILEPTDAEAASVALDSILPGVPGTLGVGHPSACEGLSTVAAAAGASVRRGVSDVDVQLESVPAVRYRVNGAERLGRCRLVIGADGRESAVRRRAGIALHTTEPQLLMAGLLVENLRGWPEHKVTIGTEGDVVFFVVPQGTGRARLYLLWSCDDRQRFAGPRGPRAFLDSFALACVPGSEGIVQATPAGPCATYPMNDTWTDSPVINGLALIGDAAGYSDPHIGQGLSVALRDVRILSELLLASEDWASCTGAIHGGAGGAHAQTALLQRAPDHAARAVRPRGARAAPTGAATHAGRAAAWRVATRVPCRSRLGTRLCLRRARLQSPLRARRHGRWLTARAYRTWRRES